LPEFTGERVVPDRVDPDLWNEHSARYLFASRLSRQKKVLDLACGTGYGAVELARSAAVVCGLDSAWEAISYANSNYSRNNLRFLIARCQQLPFPSSSFDLVVAFEVIEHLEDWERLIHESRRVLSPTGQFVVSTPNISYYATSRGSCGRNPYHVHEFTYSEFASALQEAFPYVSLFTQNHADSLVFQPVSATTSAELRLESNEVAPEEAHFFIGVCAMRPQLGNPAFAYIPRTGNVLRERERHIGILEEEVAQKSDWLDRLQREHQELVGQHRGLTEQLEERNRWAQELDVSLATARERIQELQSELVSEQANARAVAAAYEEKIRELEGDIAAKLAWVRDTEERLTAELDLYKEQLVQSVELLRETEATLAERTQWAFDLERARTELEAHLNMVRAYRWFKIGRKVGLGPAISGV